MKAYEWSFDGACKPGSGLYRPDTFSVGVFQWLPKNRGNGLKRGKVVKRFRGRSDNPEPVYAAAQAYCGEKNRGTE